MSIGLQIELEEVEHRIILRLSGRLDVASAPILDKKINHLIEEDRCRLLLDFTRIDYLSSAGMRVLLSVGKKLRAKEGELLLFSLSDEVCEVIKMAGFDKILHIFPSEKEALQFHK